MKNKRYPAIILSALIVLAGGIFCTRMISDWNAEALTIEEPAVHLITETADELDLKSIIHEAGKSVIQIEGHQEHHTVTGSGFLYNDKGDIITNAHVIQDTDAIYVKTADARFYPAAVVGMSEETDIAVIRVPQLAGRDTLPISETGADIGDEVIALGSPHGFHNTVTLGIISGTDRNLEADGFTYSDAYQISAQITYGNSGGPLLKSDTGEVIGINSVGTDDGLIGFSIPIHTVMEQIEAWSEEAENEDLNFASITDVIDNSNMEQHLQDAIYLTEYFWDSIAIRDYVSAYSLLGSSQQQTNPYSEFRNRYIHIIDLLLSEAASEVTDNNQIETMIDVSIIEREEGETEETTTPKSFVFTFSLENDQLKIINIQETSE